ncbi:hypothetical protein V8F33_013109 [Rhypophila sp. PSN 637]
MLSFVAVLFHMLVAAFGIASTIIAIPFTIAEFIVYVLVISFWAALVFIAIDTFLPLLPGGLHGRWSTPAWFLAGCLAWLFDTSVRIVHHSNVYRFGIRPSLDHIASILFDNLPERDIVERMLVKSTETWRHQRIYIGQLQQTIQGLNDQLAKLDPTLIIKPQGSCGFVPPLRPCPLTFLRFYTRSDLHLEYLNSMLLKVDKAITIANRITAMLERHESQAREGLRRLESQVDQRLVNRQATDSDDEDDDEVLWRRFFRIKAVSPALLPVQQTISLPAPVNYPRLLPALEEISQEPEPEPIDLDLEFPEPDDFEPMDVDDVDIKMIDVGFHEDNRLTIYREAKAHYPEADDSDAEDEMDLDIYDDDDDDEVATGNVVNDQDIPLEQLALLSIGPPANVPTALQGTPFFKFKALQMLAKEWKFQRRSWP